MDALRRTLARRPSPFALLLAGAALLSAGLTLAHQVNYGPGLQWDSIEYISVARSLRDGAGFTRFFGGTLRAFPPLYPSLLAGASLGLFDPHAVAGPLNAVIMGLTVVIVGVWLRRRLESRLLAVWGILAVALAPPLLWMASWAMSETAFILLATLALIYTAAYLDSRRRSRLLAAAALAALAVLTRYLGVTVIAVGVAMLLFRRRATPAERAKDTAIYALIAAAPAALWMLRTYLLTGTPAGSRNYPRYSISDIWNVIAGTLSDAGFLLSAGAPAYVAIVAAGIILAGAAGAVGYALIRSFRADSGTEWAGRRPFLIFAGFALAYAAALLIAMLSGLAVTWGNPRHLVALYLPLLIVALLATDRALGYYRRRPTPRGILLPAFLLPALALALVIIGQSVMTARSISLANADYYRTYQGARWTNSAALQYIRAQSLTGVLFSNDPAAAYIHTVADIDARHRYLPCRLATLRPRLSAARANAAAPDIHILWFPDRGHTGCNPAGGDYDAGMLRATPWLETIHDAPDGVIFRYNPQE